MTDTSTTLCPQCHLLDQVQKVTAVVSGGSDILRKRLAKPSMPSEPVYHPKSGPSNKLGGNVLTLFAVTGILLFCGLNFSITGERNVDGSGLQNVGTVFLVSSAICGAIAMFPFVNHVRRYNKQLRIYMETEAASRIATQNAHNHWESEVKRIKKLQEVWETRLYYCHRDDIVFLANDSRSVSPERMNALLGN
jgi:hypothetical protein